MTNPYPPQQAPRKLERSRTNRVLGGVCGGVASYVNMDPTLVRVLTVVISLFTGVPIILYIIALFVIPEEDPNRIPPSYPTVGPASDYHPYPYDAAAYGQPPPRESAYPSAQSPQAATPSSPPADEAVWGVEGAPWEQRQQEASSAAQPPGTFGAEPAAAQTSDWDSTAADPDNPPDRPEDKQP